MHPAAEAPFEVADHRDGAGAVLVALALGAALTVLGHPGAGTDQWTRPAGAAGVATEASCDAVWPAQPPALAAVSTATGALCWTAGRFVAGYLTPATSSPAP